MEKLTSRQNKIIAHMRRLGSDGHYRRDCGEYLCDGVKLLEEALKWGAEIRCALWSCQPRADMPAETAQYETPQELLDYVSPMKNCQGVLFSVAMRSWPECAPGRAIVLESIQDPGNLGTILRTANALNTDTVILTGACADLWNPKTVRAAMGAHFRQRVYTMDIERLRAYLTANDYRLFGAALSETSVDIRQLHLAHTAVAIGSEGQGLSKAFLSRCDGELIIPMNVACESLNAGVAAAIIMWELSR